MKVLITEDVAMMRNILKDMLVRFCGIKPNNVFEAGDGA